jgi:hypothetical protein
MANDANKVFTAGTGRILHAPIGTTLPTNTTTALNVAFKELGYIGESGVKEDAKTSENKTKAWQNSAVVRKDRTEHDKTFSFDALEDNDEVILAAFGNGTATSYSETGAMTANEVFVIEAIDGAVIKRYVIPNGQITEVGTIEHSAGGASVVPLTITAYPDSTGKKVYRYKGAAA